MKTKRKIILDANVFLRYFLNDIPDQYKKVLILFENAKKGKAMLVVPQIIVFEIYFILTKYYKFEKNQVLDKLNSLLSSEHFQVESRKEFLKAIEIVRHKNISFVDCFLLAKSEIENFELFSFDKKLTEK